MSLPDLPTLVISFDGQRIDTQSEYWRIRASADGGRILRLNWLWFAQQQVDHEPLWDPSALHLVKLYLCDRLRYKKSQTVRGDFHALQGFTRWLATEEVSHFRWQDYTFPVAEAYLQHVLHHTADRGNAFSRLRVLYEWGTARQYPGFDAHVLRVLKSMTAPGNFKGQHVRSRHPTQGPLTGEEKWLLTRALREERGQPRDRAVVMLHLELGCNPHAAVRMKAGELHRIETAHGTLYQVDVPRVKKRTAYRETKRRAVSERLGALLDSLSLPDPDRPLLHWLPIQNPETGVNAALRRWAAEAQLISPRTGERLHLHARRFRYTLATHLAEEGASRFHIAEILDHTDLQHVEVYVAVTSRIADSVAQATDSVLQPLVQRFLGKVVESLDDPVFPDLPSNSVIPAAAPHLPRLSVGGIGLCGRHTQRDGLCQLSPPLSCYTCSLFAALRGGPHQEVLASIEAYLEAYRETADERILQQLADVRLAVQQVLQQVGVEHD